MTERRRIIEGTWSCNSCDHQGIPGRDKVCPNCRNPREDAEAKFDFGAADAASGKRTAATVTDEQVLAAAAAGEDWFCEYCAASNRGDAPKCKSCRAERSATSPRAKPQTLLPTPPPAVPAAPPPKKRSWGLILGGIGLAMVSCCGVCGIWATRTHEVKGEVVAMEWTRKAHLERFDETTKEDWRDALTVTAPVMPTNGAGERPGVADIRACRREQRTTRKVADGTERVCRTKSRRVSCGSEERCSTKDLGNGMAEEVCRDVTKYCDESYEDCQSETRYRTEPVFADKCSYTTFAWRQVDEQVLSGDEATLSWPTVSPGARERMRREESYRVKVRYEDEGKQTEHLVEPKTEAEFLAWKRGGAVTVKVDNLGSVSEVLRAP